ncbi:27960_t:CDS:2 [Racocetra persica]|uniref:27960_t:CDS:1 n=1 Tax=Racocetra persica TaxID=160502 RepID=A0ACA9NU16_9GLOM|nr:27960_t:CDS:2 [Racocetra persica]
MDSVDIINNIESEFIYQTTDNTYINTDIMESEHIFETFNNHIYHSTTDFIELKYATDAIVSKYTFETFDKVFMDNSVFKSKNALETHIDSSVVESGHIFDTFSKACATIKQYATQTNTIVILERMKNIQQNLEHNHEPCLDTVKFSTVAHKFDKDVLGLIEKLHDDGLRTKDIFSVLNSVSCKYIHKPDVYNAVSCHCQYKLHGLNEIEMLFKTLYDDENILGYTALKAAYNTERDQDSKFIQGIFWVYRNVFSEFMIAKDVLIIDATYKTNRFSMPLIVICSIDRFGSTYPLAFILVYSKTIDFYC